MSTRKSKGSVLPPNSRTKVVIRKLPPNLPEEIFWNSVSPWVSDATAVYKWYVQGHMKGSRLSPKSLLSRAYIAFKSSEDLALFSQNYDGHLFRDKQGNEYSAIVEYAPSQKLPLAPKQDTRQGTIEEDEDYQSFLALLEKGENPSAEKVPAVLSSADQPESTPLLDSLKKEKHYHQRHSKFSKDDVHFSRAKPIVPTAIVTKSGAIPATPTTPSTAGHGKNSMKNKGDLSQVPSSPKIIKKKQQQQQQVKPESTAEGESPSTSKIPEKKKGPPPGPKAEGSGKPPKPKKPKKSGDGVPSSSDQAIPSTSTLQETSTEAKPSQRGGKGGSRGGGRAIVVPKILTKQLQGVEPPKVTIMQRPVVENTGPGDATVPASIPIASPTPVINDQSEPATPSQQGFPRGGRRGFPFRGRGRGGPRGRGQ